ncbi:hypothetical protein EDD85DRAFT_865206 [Armillaria nabsnona]|nr:hypothetical protein EDD85DRAFT_865206 [Armillaria nabsnona]
MTILLDLVLCYSLLALWPLHLSLQVLLRPKLPNSSSSSSTGSKVCSSQYDHRALLIDLVEHYLIPSWCVAFWRFLCGTDSDLQYSDNTWCSLYALSGVQLLQCRSGPPALFSCGQSPTTQKGISLCTGLIRRGVRVVCYDI